MPVSRVSLDITPQAYVAAAIMLIVIPLDWLLAWITATAVHECCHCFALMVCGKNIDQFRIDIHGMQIHTNDLTQWEQLFCTFAGPGGALLLLFFGGIWPKLAICGFLQSIYNCLPLLPLDGGKILQCLLSIFLPDSTVRVIMLYISRVFQIGFFLLCLVSMMFLNMGALPLVFAVCLWVRTAQLKIPCKSMPHRVQ